VVGDLGSFESAIVRRVRARWVQAGDWIGSVVATFALAFIVIYDHWPLAILALWIAALPAVAGSNLGLVNPRARLRLRACLDLLSAIALGGVLIAQHPVLPLWLVVIGAGFASWSLMAALLLLVIFWRRGRTNAQ
jgi:hypothetical protein